MEWQLGLPHASELLDDLLGVGSTRDDPNYQSMCMIGRLRVGLRRRWYPTEMASVRMWAFVAGVVGLITLGIYIAVLVGEGNNTVSEVAPWAGAMLIASVLALVGAIASDRTLARITLLSATVLFGVLGVLAIFSIGVLLLGASVMSAVEYARVKRNEPASIG